jgi:hypothetical protein
LQKAKLSLYLAPEKSCPFQSEYFSEFKKFVSIKPWGWMSIEGSGLKVQGYSIAECGIFVNPQITPVESPLSNGVCSAEFHPD